MNLRRVEEWDFAHDWRRFWWVGPPLVLAGLIFVLITLFRDEEAVVQDRLRRAFETGASPRVDVRSHAGRIRIIASETSGVVLTGSRRGIGDTENDAFEALTTLQTRMNGDDGNVRIVSAPTGQVEGRSELVLELRVPPGATVFIDQGSGPVTVEGVLGDMVVSVLDGDITVELPQGHGFRLDGGGTLASDFPLQLEGAGPGSGFVTRDSAPQQALRLNALRNRVIIREQD
ncbi:MAG: hypothetical protein IT303_09645 [Dehalococcoidia bacterium]|nr:hypothetical protein [Dehalococcoidia bacterium]